MGARETGLCGGVQDRVLAVRVLGCESQRPVCVVVCRTRFLL